MRGHSGWRPPSTVGHRNSGQGKDRTIPMSSLLCPRAASIPLPTTSVCTFWLQAQQSPERPAGIVPSSPFLELPDSAIPGGYKWRDSTARGHRTADAVELGGGLEFAHDAAPVPMRVMGISEETDCVQNHSPHPRLAQV